MTRLADRLEIRRRVVEASNSRRTRTAPRMVPPTSIAAAYAAALGRAWAGVQRETLRILEPHLAQIATRTDAADAGVVGEVLATLSAYYEGRLDPEALVAQLALEFGQKAAAHNLDQVNRQFRVLLGVEIPAGSATAAVLATFRTQNVDLITRLAQEQRTRIEGVLRDAAAQGMRVEELRGALSNSFGFSQARAELIARDQVLKLNGQLTRAHHREAGITRYRWSTSRDERVRGRPGGQWPTPPAGGGDHFHLEGTIHHWNAPPIVDTRTGRTAHPGEDFQCRCVADPVIEFGETTQPATQRNAAPIDVAAQAAGETSAAARTEAERATRGGADPRAAIEAARAAQEARIARERERYLARLARR